MKIALTGGGTGGHLVPLVAFIRETRRQWRGKDELRFSYIGPKDDFVQVLLSHEGVDIKAVATGKLRRYGGVGPIIQNIVDLFFRMPWGVLQSLWMLFLLSPDMMFSKGGYGALPPMIAAWVLRIPMFLHESDSRPGLANLICGRFAMKIFTSFPQTLDFPDSKVIHVGNLVRKEILSGSKEEAKSLFHVVGDKPLLLILGGSQGSQRLNDMVLAMLDQALSEFEIIHQVGEKNLEQMQKEARVMINPALEQYYHAVPFLREVDLRHAYAAASLVISRAGSGVLFELAALGKPSILIPLPEAAQNHQIRNAYDYAKTGAAIVLEEPNLTPHFFMEKLRQLFSQSGELEKMSTAARSFARPDAAEIVSRYLIEYLTKK
ncbi:MAG: UDP-N-acetylglucosamine--N-acetylmuramyl-(pentapeptide) pyrophosphoryl-undecaprenol N-acetylglucosamine transferase [bacterium]|nr:UDP-N-acetylglucosamine--N-acetylmuramyl-(pentapeptide) pyrophosphoryl-undecaprenol N-acetylglucosamine transferase [bacterium]